MANKIKGLSKNKSFVESAFIILKFRFNVIRKKTKEYLNADTVENLHNLRIAIRRLRYSMENFEICYRKKDFTKMIEFMRYLQDLIGEGRDLDVLEEKIKHLSEENEIEVPEALYQSIEKRKVDSTHNIKLMLMKFLKDKEIKGFFTNKI
ncbi:MAG: CHAD domain-containing protein [Ignavibacteriales bacterium]|nr:CHAD domain-containing protein [Ignavibacteriales bacterium]